jgi:hypothetical protein
MNSMTMLTDPTYPNDPTDPRTIYHFKKIISIYFFLFN